MLTKKQKKIYDFVTNFIEKNDYSPSLEEIGHHFKLAISTIHEHIEGMKRKGYLKKRKQYARSIEPKINEHNNLISIPILGTIAAGSPINVFEEEKKETIAVPRQKYYDNKNYFGLKVQGESMIDDRVADGDTVIVKSQQTATDGQRVVALIDNYEVTLKKIYKEGKKIRLQPANSRMDPIIVDAKRLLVQGIVVDVIKNRPPEIEINIDEKIKKYNKLPINQIICGDALTELRKFPDNSVDLIIADPPYGISRDLNCKNQKLGSTAKINFNFGTWDKFSKKWFEIAIRKTKGWIFTFCAKKDIGEFWKILERNNFVGIDTIVWQKPDPIPLNAKTKFLNAWEALVSGKKAGSVWNSNYQHNIIKIQAPKGKDRIHPTQKPVGLIKTLVQLTTSTNALVLDPFMGSGTTAVACIESKRRFIGIEKSKKFVKLARQRIKYATPALF